MRVLTTIEGQRVDVDISHETGSVRFTSPVLSKEYRTPQDIETALKAWDLAQRKNFTNPEAWMVQRTWGEPAKAVAVTVTSVSPDGKEVWARINGKREKKYMSDLFANPEEVKQALKVERQNQQAIKDAWEACARWTPTTTNAAEAAFPGGATMDTQYEKTQTTETETLTPNTPSTPTGEPDGTTTTTTTETPSTGNPGASGDGKSE